MPVGTDTQIFGPNGSGEEVTLPFNLYSGKLRYPTSPLTRDVQRLEVDEPPDDDRCVLTIHTQSGPDIMTWRTIYRAATEMEAKCVTQGKSAAIAGLGKTHRSIWCVQ